MNKKLFFLLLLLTFISINVSAATILDENFNTDFNGWTVTAGGFNIVSNLLESDSNDSVISIPINYDVNDPTFIASTRIGTFIAGNTQFCFNEPDTALGTGACKSFNIINNLSSGSIEFRRGSTILLTLQNAVANTIYDVNVIRTSGGIYDIYVNNVFKGNVTNTGDINGTFTKMIYGDSGSGFGKWGYTSIFTGTTLRSITINHPRDEQTNLDINTGFDLIFDDNRFASVSNQTIFPYVTFGFLDANENVVVTIVDNNSNGQQYYARNYVADFTNGQSTVIINPYLIKIVDGILVNAKVIDLASNLTLPNIRVILSNSNGTVLQDQLTNIIGVTQLVMLQGRNYQINVMSPNRDTNYLEGTFQAVTTAITLVINYSSSIVSYEGRTITTSFSPIPSSFVASGATQQIDFNVSTNYDINGITVQALDQNGVIRDTAISSGNIQSSFTLNLSQFDGNFIVIKINVGNHDSNTILYKTYNFIGQQNNLITSARNWNSSLSSISIAMLIIFIMIGTIFFLGQNPYGNNDSQVFPVAIIGGALFYLLLPSMFLVYLAGLLACAFAWLWVRSVR